MSTELLYYYHGIKTCDIEHGTNKDKHNGS